MTKATFVDLFAGAGGLSFGLSQAGWQPLLAVDNWRDAVDTYRRYHDGLVLCEDVRRDQVSSIIASLDQKPDWIVGGPPCQGFSTVGKRNRDDPRNKLVWEFLRIVEDVRPPHVLIENVLGLRDMDFVRGIQGALEDAGYRTTPFVLRAADYGVPQLRRRVFFIGDASGRYFRAPAGSHTSDQWVTVEDAIGDLPVLRAGEKAEAYDKLPTTDYQRRMRLGSECLQGHVASNHPDYLVKAISYIPDGGNRRHIPDEHQPTSGFHNSYSRLHSASPAVAVTQNMGKPSGTRCIHPFQNRGLTAREGARLQGFPDRYHFAGGIMSQRTQIANAVPPVLAEILGRALADPDSFVIDASEVLDLFEDDQYLMVG